MKILHFADLHLGVETYGHINPETGLSTRLEDFLRALDKLVDYAIEQNVDLVLFCGDAYKSRDPSQTQQREFARRLARLSHAGIPVFLLAGNHDQPNAQGRATTTEIFATLDIPGVYVSSKPDVYVIKTKISPIQVASLPWLRRSTLLAREEVQGMTLEQINDRLEEALTGVIAAHAARLDPKLPSVLAAHVSVSCARLGSERTMAIGQEHSLLLSNIANSAFDYIALGHIHSQQVLCSQPPVVYAGSLERVDFGEEDDDKGFYVVDIESDGKAHRSTFEFHKLEGRPFLTISIDIAANDENPTRTVLQAVEIYRTQIAGAIVRLQVRLTAAQEAKLHDSEIRAAFNNSEYLVISREVLREARLRLGSVLSEGLKPQRALELYLSQTNYPAARIEELQHTGEELINALQTEEA